MPKTFFISDTHLGHKKILQFEAQFRPFGTIEEHDAHVVAQWNKIVGPEDIVYHLGDVAWNRDALSKIGECHGTKFLVMGNHDKFETTEYLKYFKNVYGTCVVADHVLTHIPIHPDQKRWWKGNIHGHLHSSVVNHIREDERKIPDSWYNCVSCEQIDFMPVTLEELSL